MFHTSAAATRGDLLGRINVAGGMCVLRLSSFDVDMNELWTRNCSDEAGYGIYYSLLT